MCIIDLHDRLTRGFFAGVLGGVVTNIVGFTSAALGIAELLFFDWASVFMFGYRFSTTAEAVAALFGQLFFSGITGIVFAYLIAWTSSRNLLLKGWIYGIFIWLSFYGLVVFFKVTPLIPHRLDTAMSSIVSASLYGLVVAIALRKMTPPNEVKD